MIQLPERQHAYRRLSIEFQERPGTPAALQELRELHREELASARRSEQNIARGLGKPAWLAGQRTNVERRHATARLLESAIQAGITGDWAIAAECLQKALKTAPLAHRDKTTSNGNGLPSRVVEFLLWLASHNEGFLQWEASQKQAVVLETPPETPPETPQKCTNKYCNHPEHQ